MLSNLLVLIAELVRWTLGGRLPAVHQCCQKRGRCFPSGSSLNINGLPYWGVVLSTPQEGPHGLAAIRAALPQGEKLDRRPRPPIAEEPPKPAKPPKTSVRAFHLFGFLEITYSSSSVFCAVLFTFQVVAVHLPCAPMKENWTRITSF